METAMNHQRKIAPRREGSAESEQSIHSEAGVDLELVRRDIREGLTPDQIHSRHGRRRRVYLAAIEEEARALGELGVYEPSDDSVLYLRDRMNLRWERVAARMYGDAGRTDAAKALYDQAKGPGSASRSYTGRGRRFSGMSDGD